MFNQTLIEIQGLTLLRRGKHNLRDGSRYSFHGANFSQYFFQRTGVRRFYLEDKAFISRHMMALEHVVVLQHLRGKLVHVPLVADGNTDKSRYVLADFLAINDSLITPDDSTHLQLLHTLHHGWRRKLYLLSYVS